MCMNCGCGDVETRHKESDIVRSDIERAAKGQNASMEDTARNLEQSLGKVRSGGQGQSGQGQSGQGQMASSGSSRTA